MTNTLCRRIVLVGYASFAFTMLPFASAVAVERGEIFPGLAVNVQLHCFRTVGVLVDHFALDALAEVSNLGKRQDSVAVGFGGHVVDQVGDAIFEPPCIKAINDMGNEWARVIHAHRASRVAARSCSICGLAASANAASLAGANTAGA